MKYPSLKEVSLVTLVTTRKYFCVAGREAERVLLVVHVVPDVSARRARGARDRVVPGAR